MFPFKANAFSFVVNTNADAIKVNLKKRIDSYWLLEPQGNIRLTGKIKRNKIILQKEYLGRHRFYPVIVFTLEVITGNTTRVTGYFCLSLFVWFSLLLLFGIGIYVSLDVKKEQSITLLIAGFLLVIFFINFLILYFTFQSNHKMWVSELKTILAADLSKQTTLLP